VHDNLTGLPNRELFMNRLEAIISVARSEDRIQPDGLRHRHRPLQAGQ
jgi:GGDEF domain-containing protein